MVETFRSERQAQGQKGGLLKQLYGDFTGLVANVRGQYEGLTPAQRTTQINNWATFQSLTDTQKLNALAFAVAVMLIALDYIVDWILEKNGGGD